jgi:phospholipase C
MTEGRSIVIEANGFALTNPNTTAKQFTTTPATPDHESIFQRWVVWEIARESTFFHISSAVNSSVNGNWISQHSSLSNSVTRAEIYNITYVGQDHYYFVKENGDYLGIETDGTLSFTDKPTAFNIYAVSFHDSFPNRFPI